MDWQLIANVPRGQQVRFKNSDGSEFDGEWLPYWCGSDCPCDVAGEGEEPCTEEPDCWCAYELGDRKGKEIDPTHWRPSPQQQEMK
jgi:hypothetical protein